MDLLAANGNSMRNLAISSKRCTRYTSTVLREKGISWKPDSTRRALTKIPAAEFARIYLYCKRNKREMAKALGICQSTLQREFRRRGFKACRTGQRKWLWSKAQLERWYNEYGMSIQDICDLTGLTHNTVWKQMVNFGIPRRPAKFNHKEIKRKPPEYGQPPEKILRDWADSMVRAMTGE